jgi:hypothetical protein
MNYNNFKKNNQQRYASPLQSMYNTLLSIELQGEGPIENSDEQEYKQYVLKLIDEFIKVQNENPLIFSIETKYLATNREAIQLRNRVINSFQYPEDRVPEKYKVIHQELLQTLAAYRESYESLYLAIAAGESRVVGENVGRLYQLDINLNRIIDDLRM